MTKSKSSQKPKQNPASLTIDQRFMTKDLARRVLEARQANPENRDEVCAAFDEEITAIAMTLPEVRSACIIQRLEGDLLNVNRVVDELRRMTSKVHGGDMATQEAMLVSQTHALDALFSNLARRASANMDAGNGEAADRYFRFALKAQAQAAKTIEILAEIKNPRPVAFVKQANIATNQQVNNGPRAENFENPPSKLSGETYELLENTGTQSLEGGNDQTLEALGALNGAAISRG